jgi:hypothetical protein
VAATVVMADMEVMEATVVMDLLTTHLAVVASMLFAVTGAIWPTTGRGTILRI